MPLIQLNDLTRTYKSGDTNQAVLNKISLSIEPATFVGLHGRSGSGKTTLLQILGCIDPFDSGSYHLDGQSISTLSYSELSNLRKHKIGFIFQNFNLISTMTAFENVEFPLVLLDYPAKERQKMTNEILKSVGLEGFENRFPEQLSGGQRQRVSIARALVKKPLLVIADEPTANLDEENSNNIARLLLELQKNLGVTIICSSHDRMFLDNCDLKISIKDGMAIKS